MRYINLKLEENDPLMKKIDEIKEKTGIKTNRGAIRAGLLFSNGDDEKK